MRKQLVIDFFYNFQDENIFSVCGGDGEWSDKNADNTDDYEFDSQVKG